MIFRVLVRFVGAVLFWRRYEGMSLRPFGADGCGDDFKLPSMPKSIEEGNAEYIYAGKGESKWGGGGWTDCDPGDTPLYGKDIA